MGKEATMSTTITIPPSLANMFDFRDGEDKTNYGDWTRAELDEYNKHNPMALIECMACDEEEDDYDDYLYEKRMEALGEHPDDGDKYHICDQIITGVCPNPVWVKDSVLKRNDQDLWLCPECFEDEDDEDVCQTQHCKNPTSTINFHEGDAPREYCEECYKADQDDDSEDDDK